jgi:iduronate 2-sulfatase
MRTLQASLITVLLFGFAVRCSAKPLNVLFVISDDLTSTALSCYGNKHCQTPNIDRLAARGTRFTRAYCQAAYCGPSRASFLSGYYPHGSGELGYASPPSKIGDRQTWPQFFKDNGYYAARVGKNYHMGVPIDIESGANGTDDPRSWTERFNSQGPEWKAPGEGETLQDNPGGNKPVMGGNTFAIVEAEGDDLVHADGKTAAKAVELIHQHRGKPFWLGVGLVRPHVPFVAPRAYFKPFKPFEAMLLPEKVPGDWDDIPRLGINYCTSQNMKMDLRRQKTALAGYYASVAYMDAQVGKVLGALEAEGLADETIVIFTSDHGYHLGEHDFWAKVSLHEESASVPLIISVPGKRAAVCHSLVELLDLYPTTAKLCGNPPPSHLQGRDISDLLDEPDRSVRTAAFSVSPMRDAFLLRSEDHAFIQYKEDASGGVELYDMRKDSKQYTNLAKLPEHARLVEEFHEQLTAKLRAVRNSDLRN